MRIRMRAQMSGTRDGQPWPARGEIADLPAAEAAHAVASGIAEHVDVGDVETATVSGAETAEPLAAEVSEPAEPEVRRGRGRPRKPRDEQGNIIKE